MSSLVDSCKESNHREMGKGIEVEWAKVGKLDQAGGTGCHDLLRKCDGSHREEALGSGGTPHGGEVRSTREGVAECDRCSHTSR